MEKTLYYIVIGVLTKIWYKWRRLESERGYFSENWKRIGV